MGFLQKMTDWNDRQREKAQERIDRADRKMTEASQKMRDLSQTARFGPFTLNPDGTVTHKDGLRIETTSPGDSVRARVESGAELEKRVTATRLIMLGGIGGLIWKKRSGGESWLTVESTTDLWIAKVDRKDDGDARRFAAAVNRTSRVSA